jgi:hypothetical protein
LPPSPESFDEFGFDVIVMTCLPPKYLDELHFVLMMELRLSGWTDLLRLSSDFYA